MPMSIDVLVSRVEVLEKQIALLMADKNLPEVDSKSKKVKKSKLVDSDEDKPKKKRVSGYLLFSSAVRNEVRTQLFGDDKPKNSDIMVELGKRWKALSDDDRSQWNTKALAL